MYVDGDGPADIILRLPAGEYRVTWVNVSTSETKDGGSFRHAGGDKTLSTPAVRNGVALRLTRMP